MPSDAADAAHCEALVREHDRDRYLATLFAPAEARTHLFALYAFASEVARIRDAVSSPLPGQIRLQWWRDALAGEARGDAAAHPVAAALEATIGRFALPRAALAALVDAREFDLYDDLWPTTNDLEGYLGETSSALFSLAALILAGGRDPGSAEAAGHAGVAWGLAGILRDLPWDAGRGRAILPRDLLDRNGVTRDDVVRGRGGPGFVAALAELRALARSHLGAARTALRDGDPAIRPAFLPLALVPGDLAATERPGYEPFRTIVARPAWLTIARLWWASRRGP